MPRKTSDLLIHPVRIRIVTTLQRQAPLTVAQIHSFLPELNQRTLYRHLEQLVEGGVVEVVELRQVRGTYEQLFQLARPALFTAEERRNATAEEWEHFFTFITSLLNAEFAAFVRSRYGATGLPPDNAVRIGELAIAPADVPLLASELITRAEALAAASPEAKDRYRISLLLFPLAAPTPSEEQQ
jgi:predicted ArsR family transcriptional regulator